ncbi:TRAP transporter small permease [Desulfocastanea catecholica]
MNQLKLLEHYIFKIFLILASMSLISMMLIVTANVIGRLFFDFPIMGSFEIAGLSGVILGGIALGYTEKERRNVTVEILVMQLPSRIKSILDGFTLTLSLIGVGFLSWAVSKEALHAAINGEKTMVVGIPTFPFKIVWAIGTMILCYCILKNIIASFRKGFKK